LALPVCTPWSTRPDTISPVGADESAEAKLVGQLFLGGLGLFLLAGGGWAYFGGQDDQLVGGFFLLAGLLLVVLAAFYSRVDGLVELGLLKIPAGKARRAELQIEQGRVVAGADLEEARKAVDEALARHHLSQVATPAVSHVAATSEPAATAGVGRGSSVLLAQDAVFMMTTLTPNERDLVDTEIARMSRADFPTNLDLRATKPGDAGRSYRMHRVPECDVRLWYRQKSASEPHVVYVMVIEKTGEDH
jgi:hypothetical protein